ncbi:MAG: bifunctional tetrahydrofolate synthase/dihydrofolate synthase [Psychromonas sp.]|nr:bifunctional tetrahydrofolate synthase/dihydrofolate synthase [Psychromonas sp.]
MNKTLPEWISYVTALHSNKIELGLDRITQVGKKMDLISFEGTVITVAGTNGKGTTCAFLEEMLVEAGYKVGVYSSPHILRYTERLRINKEELSDDAHCNAFSVVERYRQKILLSFFEYVTLSCLYLLKLAQCDFILLEVGLGGRLDATNMVDSDLSVITTIAIDHTDWLGNDREVIGFEKAGVFRPFKPVVCGEYDPPKSLINHAKSINARITFAGKDFHAISYRTNWQWQGKTMLSLLPFSAMPQQNCSTALAVIDALSLDINPNTLKKAIGNAALAGRFEKIDMQIKNDVYLDVAHNPQSAKYLAKQLNRIRDAKLDACRIFAIVGMLKDKDCSGNFSELNVIVDEYQVISLDCERGATVAELDVFFQNSIKTINNVITYAKNIEEAYKNILLQINSSDIIVVFGSFYTVAAFLKFQGSECE